MGMTDRQFYVYLRSQLRELKRIRNKVEELTDGKKIEELEELIKDTETELQRP